MTVNDLIKALRELDQNRDVVLFSDEEGNSISRKFDIEYYEGNVVAFVPLEQIDPLDLE